MKTYKQLLEVMSLSDMNKIKGGTDHQRKIAQDRQRRREAREKGFDPNKSVLADGSKPSEEKKAEAQKSNSSALTKTNTPTKPNGLVKADQKALPASEKRKPDLRRSQLGKWAEGSKKSPGALAKKSETGLRKEPAVKQVDVKVDDAKAGERPGTTKPKPQKPQKPQKEVGKNLEKEIKKKAKEKARSEAEARAAEKHQWAKEDRAARKADKERRDAEKAALAAKKATRSGRAELARDAAKKAKEAETAKWDAKVPGSRLASVANKGRKGLQKGLRKGLNLGKKVLDVNTDAEVGTSQERQLQGLQQRNKGLGN